MRLREKYDREQEYCRRCLYSRKGCAPGLFACRYPDLDDIFPSHHLATMEAGERGYCKRFAHDLGLSDRKKKAIVKTFKIWERENKRISEMLRRSGFPIPRREAR